MSLLEVLAVALGVANIALLVRRSIWNFPFGIAMVTLYAVIFFRARLYSEAGLQVFFALVNAYGWALWARARQEEPRIAVRWLPARARFGWIAATLAGALVLGTMTRTYTNAAMPYPDALVTSGSVVAQLLLSWRFTDNWGFWIVIDIVGIVLYLRRGLTLTAGLYCGFLVLSAIGLKAWLRWDRNEGSIR